MDHRRCPRFSADQPVTVTILGKPPRIVPAIVRDASGRGLGLEMVGNVQPGAALQIELDDVLVLGEVVHVRPAPAGGMAHVGVRLEEALTGLAELARACLAFQPQAGKARTPATTEAASTPSNPQRSSMARN